MPKCVNVVILVIVTNIVTLTIFSNLKYEKLPSLSDAVAIIPGYSTTSGQNGVIVESSGWVWKIDNEVVFERKNIGVWAMLKTIFLKVITKLTVRRLIVLKIFLIFFG